MKTERIGIISHRIYTQIRNNRPMSVDLRVLVLRLSFNPGIRGKTSITTRLVNMKKLITMTMITEVTVMFESFIDMGISSFLIRIASLIP